MPRTRMDELYAIAEEHDGLLTSKQARAQGIQDSVLVRLAQRGRLERMSRGVYRIAHFPAGPACPVPGGGPVGTGKPRTGTHRPIARDGTTALRSLGREPGACASHCSTVGADEAGATRMDHDSPSLT